MMLFLKATIKNKKVEGFALFHYLLLYRWFNPQK